VDEFTRLFQIWNDPEFLEEFFTQYEDDLQSGFFRAMSKKDAVFLTWNEARRLEKELKKLAKNPHESLDAIFKPLNNTTPKEFEFVTVKAKGDQHKSWLRIYALKIDENVYVITGGTIKITRKMIGRPHTEKELRKLERCRSFLKERGITDIGSFLETSI